MLCQTACCIAKAAVYIAEQVCVCGHTRISVFFSVLMFGMQKISLGRAPFVADKLMLIRYEHMYRERHEDDDYWSYLKCFKIMRRECDDITFTFCIHRVSFVVFFVFAKHSPQSGANMRRETELRSDKNVCVLSNISLPFWYAIDNGDDNRTNGT